MVDFTPSGIECGSDCSEQIYTGADVTLTATPLNGSFFGGWSGACSGNSTTCTLSGEEGKNVTATFIHPPVNGACDDSNNGQTLTAVPSANLCAAGAASVVSGSGPWSWICSGLYGGATASCSSASSQTYAGACGSSNGLTLKFAPTNNLCATGAASAVTGNGPWNWSCNGVNSGTTATCSAYTGVETTLKAGWNLLGWTTHSGYYEGAIAPVASELISNATMTSVGIKMISEAFTTIGFTTGDTFVAVGPGGVVYTPGSPFNTLKKLLPGKGYWLYVPSEKTLTIPGADLTETDELPLSEGWTQIGYWGTDAATTAAGFASINGKYDVVVDEVGKVFVIGSPFNTLKTLQKNKGYFIHTTAPATLRY